MWMRVGIGGQSLVELVNLDKCEENRLVVAVHLFNFIIHSFIFDEFNHF